MSILCLQTIVFRFICVCRLAIFWMKGMKKTLFIDTMNGSFDLNEFIQQVNVFFSHPIFYWLQIPTIHMNYNCSYVAYLRPGPFLDQIHRFVRNRHTGKIEVWYWYPFYIILSTFNQLFCSSRENINAIIWPWRLCQAEVIFLILHYSDITF